jgi:hypothetical protein
MTLARPRILLTLLLAVLALLACLPAAAQAHGLPQRISAAEVAELAPRPAQPQVRALAAAKTAAPTYKIGGQRWPGRTITYYNALPASNKAYQRGMAAAITEWNARGIGTRFVRVSGKRRAQVVISHNGRSNPGGRATLGYWGGQGWVHMNMPRGKWEDIAWVASHELGHILGLGHARGCTVMSDSAYDDCAWPQNPWEWRCRLQERMDLVGARKLYGGKLRPRPIPMCLKSPAAAPVKAPVVTPSVDRTTIATLSWARPARAVGFMVARSKPGGPCESDFRQALAGPKAPAFADLLGRWELPTAGAYCYSIWSTNVDGAPTGPTTVSVSYQPPLPAAPTDVSAVYTTDEWGQPMVQVSWMAPAGADDAAVLRSEPGGPCLTDPEDRAHRPGYNAPPTLDFGPSGGFLSGQTFCYTVLSTDDEMRTLWSPPVMVYVTIP